MTSTLRPRNALVLAAVAAVGACAGNVTDRPSDMPAPAPARANGGAPGTSGMGGAPGAMPATPDVPITGAVTSAPGRGPRLARLSHRQWENTVRDLLRLPKAPGLSATFTSEPSRGNFDDNGAFLQVSPGLWLDYQRAAETLATATVADPNRLKAAVPANLPADPGARGRAFVEQFGLRAYRRPLAKAEADQYAALFDQGAQLVGSGIAFNDGVQVVLTAMLQSPGFIYRQELSDAPGADGKIHLDPYEVASKLSYTLAGSMPDDMLFAAATQGQLATRDGVLAQARRLLASAAAADTMRDFHDQLLNLNRYDQVSKDSTKFPEWKGVGASILKTESETFVKDVVFTRDKGLTELLTSPYTFVNAALAQVYGVMGPATGFARVDLDPAQRAGILTQVGFLASYADGAQPQTILRGAFVNRDILCADLPPPPDAFTLPPVMGTTNRQRIEAATTPPACAPCHVRLINPPGFALEQFDAIGKFRTTDNGHPVDATGTYTFDGVPRNFNGGVELSKLVAASQQAHDCYARNWLEYAYGRLVDMNDPSDAMLVAQLGARSRKGAFSVRALLLEMVGADAFLTRAPAEGSP